MWVILLEKAWAKIHGSYDTIIAGNGAEALRDITGAPSFNYDIKDEETWDRIVNAYNLGYIVVTSTKSGNKAVDYDKLGLVDGHEYAIL
jgi:calpain-15